MQLILPFHTFHICEFYSLKFIYKPKLILAKLVHSFMDTRTVVKNLSLLMYVLQAVVRQDNALPCCLSSNTVNKNILLPF